MRMTKKTNFFIQKLEMSYSFKSNFLNFHIKVGKLDVSNLPWIVLFIKVMTMSRSSGKRMPEVFISLGMEGK